MGGVRGTERRESDSLSLKTPGAGGGGVKSVANCWLQLRTRAG